MEAHYINIANNFFPPIIVLYHLDWENERFTPEAKRVINYYECYFTQLITYSYIRVTSFDGKPYVFPRCVNDKWALMELVRQFLSHQISAQNHVMPPIKFHVVIGNYSFHIIQKVKMLDGEMNMCMIKFLVNYEVQCILHLVCM